MYTVYQCTRYRYSVLCVYIYRMNYLILSLVKTESREDSCNISPPCPLSSAYRQVKPPLLHHLQLIIINEALFEQFEVH